VQRRVVVEAQSAARFQPLSEPREVRTRYPLWRGRPERPLLLVDGFHDRSVQPAYNDW
jgi:hypothetical protein